MKIVLENLLRNEDGRTVKKEDIEAVAAWLDNRGKTEHEIAFRPARVLMQDFTGVPAVVDLAAMRDAMVALGGDPHKINPLVPVDLVIDHSVVVDYFGTSKSLAQNVKREYEQNQERYRFLKWGQQAFSNFSVVPPGTGICHQVNLEYLAQTVWTAKEKRNGKSVEIAYPDTLVGTDSHTTMVNGLAVLGWGVGGIEAEAAMLGQPLSMLLPEVVGFKLTGELREGVTATDLVLTVTQMLRKKGVVGKFVEFFGPGLNAMSVADRATIANMAPEYGATCGLFPIDGQALGYLDTTSRKAARIALVEAYAKAQGIYRTRLTPDPVFTDTLELELGEVAASLAGPKRPQDRVPLADAKAGFVGAMTSEFKQGEAIAQRYKVEGSNFDLGHGDVVIAAITSCTNTSNPSVMMAAGLLARNAVAKGLAVKPWVKTSLAPGSQVVEEYLEAAELQKPLDKLGFNIVGYGCTTCIGNSGPLAPAISATIAKHNLVAAAVLSGNRNFEGRVNPDVRANYLASPPLVVAYALAGSMQVDLIKEPIGHDKRGQPVYLADIWPTSGEVQDLDRQHHHREDVQDQICQRLRRRRELEEGQGAHRPRLCLGHGFDLCAEPALFRGHDDDARADRGRRRRAHPRAVPRFDHDRPYLAGGFDPPEQPGGPISARASGSAGRLQSIRHASRQSRSHDARHLRQHPHQEPDGEGRARRGRRGRLHHPLSLRGADVDLRRRDAISEREGSAHRVRGPRIRHRLLARLGGQGHEAARRARGGRAELRAHPSLQSRRHGRIALRVRRGNLLEDAGIEGRRDGFDPWTRADLKPRQRSRRKSSRPTARRRACR